MAELFLLPSEELTPPAWLVPAAAGPVRCFNPGLLPDGDGWLVASRVVGPDGARRVSLSRLDSSFGVVPGSAVPLSDLVRFRPGALLDERARGWFADPRLYRISGRTWLSWNSGWHAPLNHQYLVEIDPASLRPSGPARELLLEGPRRPIEKNWTLFGEERTFAVYAVSPHRVLSLSLDGEDDVLLRTASETAWDPGLFPGLHGELRGGAPPQRDGESWTSFCHSVGGPEGSYRYVPSAYRFGAVPPFAPTHAPRTRVPLPNPFGPARAHPRLNPVVEEVLYPSGAARVRGGWVVSYGINDELCAVARLGAEEVAATLEPVGAES